WEIVSELASNPFDVTSGNTFFTTPASADFNAVMNMAQSYLGSVTSNGSGPQAQGLQALTVNGNQDFLVQVVSTAPEPGTWLMLILGFGMVGHAMRQRRAPNALAIS
ncbi:MAG: PEP-CTERM sorting domain-containing protein, partial [Rhizobiaceae bacterium]